MSPALTPNKPHTWRSRAIIFDEKCDSAEITISTSSLQKIIFFFFSGSMRNYLTVLLGLKNSAFMRFFHARLALASYVRESREIECMYY